MRRGRMCNVISTALILLLLGPIAAQAQKIRPIPYMVIPNPKFERAIENGTRSKDGAPGPNYWTNTADYKIRASLDPATRMLRGSESILYHNNSPDDLNRVVIHLRQNLHSEGVIRNRPQQVTGGVNLISIKYGDEEIGSRPPDIGRPIQSSTGYWIDGTLMTVVLPETLESGQSGTFSLEWEFEVPELGAPRMGTDDEVYFIAYWYPQIAVYDDVNGWKADPYMGSGEFYMGYGNFDVSLTVPENWLVAATGELQNASEVLSEQTISRLSEAANTHEIVNIVTRADVEAGSATLRGDLTWRFAAENVRDFAFGTSDKYLWDATTAEVGDRDGDNGNDLSMIHAFYRPGRNDWNRSAEYGQFSIEFLSEMFFPYPYPHMTAVEGIIRGGMEYPMITIIGSGRPGRSVFGVTLHEIGHMYFPMIVGQDEKQFTWMDEGLTQFNEFRAEEARWGESTEGRMLGFMSQFFTSGGEVDLIARKDDCLAFVEVKARLQDGSYPPEERVRSRKRSHLTRAARHYLARLSPAASDLECRFDIVAVVFHAGRRSPEITHLENAFQVSLR
ncbi:MAG: YraN family protein [Bacteroidetes bacterium]|nr:YraN family protein [Bacteroidota bacterium]